MNAAHIDQVCLLEALLDQRQSEGSFLAGRSNENYLTLSQRATVVERIEHLKEECKTLRWMLCLQQLARHDAA
jgi:hypothetical protein